MGADENAEAKASVGSEALAESVKLALEHGWTLAEGVEGQILLVPPPSYGEPPNAA